MPETPPHNLGSAMQFPPAPSDPAQAHLQAVMRAAITGSVPRFYANAVGVAITPADLVLTMMCNGTPVCVINLAIPTAKGVADDVAVALKDYERTSEQTLMAIGQIAAAMQRNRRESGEVS